MEDSPISTLIIVAAILGGLWYFFKKPENADGLTPDVAYPKGTQTIPSDFNPNIWADRLFLEFNKTALFHADFLKDRSAIYNQLLGMNNATLISVNNVYNKKYGGKGSLVSRITAGWDSLLGYPAQTEILARLKGLNCR